VTRPDKSAHSITRANKVKNFLHNGRQPQKFSVDRKGCHPSSHLKGYKGV